MGEVIAITTREAILSYWDPLCNPTKSLIPTYRAVTILHKLREGEPKICGIFVIYRGKEFIFLINQSFLDEEEYSPAEHNASYIKATKNMLRRLQLDEEDKAKGAFKFICAFYIVKGKEGKLFCGDCLIGRKVKELGVPEEDIIKGMNAGVFVHIKEQLPSLKVEEKDN